MVQLGKLRLRLRRLVRGHAVSGVRAEPDLPDWSLSPTPGPPYDSAGALQSETHVSWSWSLLYFPVPQGLCT